MHRSGSAFTRVLLGVLLIALLGGGPLAAPGAAMTARAPTALASADLSPGEAPTDRERIWSNGCLAWETKTAPASCVYGNRSGSFTLALVGDSHASHLFAGFERLAKQRGWRLVLYLKVSCPFLDIPIRNFLLDREYTECAAWNRTVLRKLQVLRPDLTVTVAFRGIHPMDQTRDTAGKEGAAIGRMLAKVPGRRAIIVDTPWSSRNIPACLAARPARQETCRIPSSEVLSVGVRTRERAAADVGGATYLDLTSAICAGFPCRVVRDGVVMFRDNHHLTNTYAATLRDALGKALDRALD